MTSISSGIALTDVAMQSAWKREPTIPILTFDTLSPSILDHFVGELPLPDGTMRDLLLKCALVGLVVSGSAGKTVMGQVPMQNSPDPMNNIAVTLASGTVVHIRIGAP
jgi:hypothetical protein